VGLKPRVGGRGTVRSWSGKVEGEEREKAELKAEKKSNESRGEGRTKEPNREEKRKGRERGKTCPRPRHRDAIQRKGECKGERQRKALIHSRRA